MTHPALLTALPLAAGASALLAWAVVRHNASLGLLDRPGGRKTHGRPTPRAGGPALLAGAWGVPALLGQPFPPLLWAGLGAALALGLADDLLGDRFPWRLKLLGQLGAGVLAGAALFPGEPAALAGFALYAGLLQNAVNFQDNMNGLAAGTGLLLCLLLGWRRAGETWALPALAAAAALAPLLGANFPRARLFLGDQATHLLGLTLAILAAAPGSHPPALAGLVVPALPVIDLAATLAYRQGRGLSLFQADHNHLSHRLDRAGLGPVGAVGALWAAALLAGLLLPWLAAVALGRGGA